jgi:NAD(P)-dependent dehydrogenase (short-subunit alcohol dehydrogenase family)
MRVIISISSDIGTSIGLDWLKQGEHVVGTYRTWSKNCDDLLALGATLVHCDLIVDESQRQAVEAIAKLGRWDVLVIAPGTQEPVGLFEETPFDKWEESIAVNFTKPISILHRLLTIRNSGLSETSRILFFAGGGTNSATERYSAYTVSKIALIKICELLDFEFDDCAFSILGPGWVESKIHEATITAASLAGDNYLKTLEMRRLNLMNPVSIVVDACNWILTQPKEVVGGRNFSAVNDKFHDPELVDNLISNPSMYKLRRSGNSL